MNDHIDELVNRFLAWKLPQTVCADLCATDNKYPHSRSGTNLLTAIEARQMLEYVLGRSFVGTAWLIETNDQVGPTLYYCGEGDWCSNPNHAMKWPSKAAAETSEAWPQLQYPGNMRIAEHEWAP